MRQLFEYHERIGYRFIPGIKARVPNATGGYLVRANNLGFRCDHDVVPQRPPGQRRALLFGDSFTAGDGVSNGSRYGDLLEQHVDRLEVLNFGLPGTGTDQHYLAYQEFAQNVQHDLLILAVLVENIRRVAARARLWVGDDGKRVIYAKPYYRLEASELVLHNVPVPKQAIPEAELDDEARREVDRGGRFETVRRIVNRMGMREITQRITRYQPLAEYDDPRNPAWLLQRAILTRWINGHPQRVLLVVLPLYQYVEETADPSGYRARFRELVAATGCAMHDPLDDLRAAPIEERRRFRFGGSDPHLTPAGHAALAASLAPAVAAQLDVPAARRAAP